ncbi:MAG: DUF3379 domain-containing protein [Bacteroidaceae bacterium]|nr:DUF3379 domain-containing protein [Bacteroidaceae bacterium]
MSPQEINNLIARYLDGQTTPAEERQLALEVQREDAPPEWRIVAEMLGELTRDEALYDRIMAERASRPATRRMNRWYWSVAASVALVIGFSYYTYIRTPQDMAQSREAHTIKQNTLRMTIKPPSAGLQISRVEVKPPPPRTTPTPLPQDTILQQAPTTDPVPEQNVCPALTELLLAEITERTLAAESYEEQLYQDLLNEILLNTNELANQPELIL